MKKLRIGINGCGRIGRALMRQYFELSDPRFEIVVINEPMALDQLIYLLKFDSVHGRLPQNIALKTSGEKPESRTLLTPHGPISYLQEKQCPSWTHFNLDYVVDLSGAFTRIEDVRQHLHNGAARVLLGAPLRDDEGIMCRAFPEDSIGILPGASVLDQPESARILSSFSCTTQALLTLLKPLLEADLPAIQSVMVTELHGFTSSQALVDGPHADWRRGRSATESIIPTATQGIFGVEYFYPELANKLAGYSVRVPVPNVAAVNVCLHLETTVTLNDVLEVYKGEAVKNNGVLGVDVEPTVSCDYIGRTESAVLATDLCQVNHHQLRLYAWYDNEYGYARRILESINVVKVN